MKITFLCRQFEFKLNDWSFKGNFKETISLLDKILIVKILLNSALNLMMWIFVLIITKKIRLSIGLGQALSLLFKVLQRETVDLTFVWQETGKKAVLVM